jgi:acylpyruvate hydrolase
VTAFVDESVTTLDILTDPSPARAAAAQPTGPSWPLAEVTLLAPVPAPRAIFGIGLNYADHIAETGGEPPERPIVFMKLPSSATAPGAAVRCPEVVRRLDYEGELAVVMSAGGAVAGYAVADDLSARDLQGREPQWTRAKGADGFCPYGPWITTTDEVPDPHALSLRTWVNGELRQDSNTSNLIFTVPELVAFIGETCTLEPGRPDPHGHASRRRHRPGPAALPHLRRRRAHRDRAARRDRALDRLSGTERRSVAPRRRSGGPTRSRPARAQPRPPPGRPLAQLGAPRRAARSRRRGSRAS